VDLSGQFGCDGLVGIEGEDPVVPGSLRGKVLLGSVSSPAFFNHTRAHLCGDFAGGVVEPLSTTTISSVNARLAESPGDIALFVSALTMVALIFIGGATPDAAFAACPCFAGAHVMTGMIEKQRINTTSARIAEPDAFAVRCPSGHRPADACGQKEKPAQPKATSYARRRPSVRAQPGTST